MSFGLWSKFDGLCLVSHATIQESVSLNVTYSVSGVTSTVSGQSVTVIAIIVNILQLLQYRLVWAHGAQRLTAFL